MLHLRPHRPAGDVHFKRCFVERSRSARKSSHYFKYPCRSYSASL